MPGKELKIPLSEDMIEAAIWIHCKLKQWKITNNALRSVARKYPGTTPEACLIKATVINSLYQTNVFAITRMANHVSSVFSGRRPVRHGPALVERIANMPGRNGTRGGRQHISFASKYAHFFIDPNRYPIYDKYANRMVKYHLGRNNQVNTPGRCYQAFVKNLARLSKAAAWTGTNRELDKYLWIAGQYRALQRNSNTRINAELHALLEKPTAILEKKLAMLPSD